MKNPRTGREMPPIMMMMGPLKIQASSGDGSYHVVAPTVGGQGVYTIAFIEPGEDGCDLRTVGRRPWEVEGVASQHVFGFCLGAMKVIDAVISGEIDA